MLYFLFPIINWVSTTKNIPNMIKPIKQNTLFNKGFYQK